MTDALRQAFAFVALCLAGGTSNRGLIDCVTGRPIEFDAAELEDLRDGRRRVATISCRDRGASLRVERTPGGWQLYDHVSAAWLDVAAHGRQMQAYHSASGTFATGQLRGHALEVFDPETQRWFRYCGDAS